MWNKKNVKSALHDDDKNEHIWHLEHGHILFWHTHTQFKWNVHINENEVLAVKQFKKMLKPRFKMK